MPSSGMGEDVVACDLGGALVQAFAAEVAAVLGMRRSSAWSTTSTTASRAGAGAGVFWSTVTTRRRRRRSGDAVLAGIATCPDATTSVVYSIEQAGGIELSGEGQACIADYLEAHP